MRNQRERLTSLSEAASGSSESGATMTMRTVAGVGMLQPEQQ